MNHGWNMGGKMDDESFEELEEQLQERLRNAKTYRDLHAFTLPNVLHSDDYKQYLTFQFTYTDRVN